MVGDSSGGRDLAPHGDSAEAPYQVSFKLILTPSLQQAIKLLPMSTLELADLLNQEMVENPLLEEVPTEELQPPTTASEKPGRETHRGEARYLGRRGLRVSFFGDYLDDGYRSRTLGGQGAPADRTRCPPAASLARHLLWQLLQTKPEEEDLKEIGAAIIGNLDDDGYLVASVQRSPQWETGPWRRRRRALQRVQTFDPIGVAARDLQECLWLQIRHIGAQRQPGREDCHRAPSLAAEPSGPRIAAQAGDDASRTLKEHQNVCRGPWRLIHKLLCASPDSRGGEDPPWLAGSFFFLAARQRAVH